MFTAKIQSLKHGVPKGDKKRKKEVQTEINALEAELKSKHENELKLLCNSDNKEAGVVDEAADKLDQALVLDGQNEDAAEPNEVQGKQRVSKAQKRREKKSQQEREREQRIANEDCSDLNKNRADEESMFKDILQSKNLRIVEVPSDGDCMYKALSHQLESSGRTISVQELRSKTADYIIAHKDEFLPFLTTDDGDILNDEQFETYCNEIRNTKAWGGQVELQALVKVLNRQVVVVQATGPEIVVGDDKTSKPLTISYHRHAYRLGEHYNSLVQIE